MGSNLMTAVLKRRGEGEGEPEQEWRRRGRGTHKSKASQLQEDKVPGTGMLNLEGKSTMNYWSPPEVGVTKTEVSLEPSEDHVPDNHLTLALSLEFTEL